MNFFWVRTMSETILPPTRRTGQIAIFVRVPEEDRADKAHDIAEAYAVEVSDEIPGGCMIWGFYHGEWHANAGARWLVSRFIEGASQMQSAYMGGGNPWWDGWAKLDQLVIRPQIR